MIFVGMRGGSAKNKADSVLRNPPCFNPAGTGQLAVGFGRIWKWTTLLSWPLPPSM